jgi:hypothetical protein
MPYEKEPGSGLLGQVPFPCEPHEGNSLDVVLTERGLGQTQLPPPVCPLSALDRAEAPDSAYATAMVAGGRPDWGSTPTTCYLVIQRHPHPHL